MVVATNAVATHAMTIDATAQAERASAWSSSVMVCMIAAGMLSRTRSITLPTIIAFLGSIGAPGEAALGAAAAAAPSIRPGATAGVDEARGAATSAACR
jgi:hypothetical protein